MKTLKKKNLDELAKVMPVISEVCQRHYVGGTSGNSGDSGGWSGEFGDSGNSDGWSGTPGGSDSSDDWSGNSNSSPLGSAENPYTASDAELMMELGTWRGGYVDGYGYVTPMVVVTPEGTDIGSGVSYVGWPGWGGNMGDSSSMSGDFGSPTNPYTMNEAQNMMNSGNWPGGFVEGYGYIAPQVNVNGDTNGGGHGGSETPVYHSNANDDMSTITGVAPGLSNAQVWEQTKYAYFKMAIELGIDLYGLDIQFSSDRSAVAWVDNKDRNIKIGDHFFEMSIQDRLSVLVHEYTHLGQGEASTEVKPLEAPVLLADGLIPEKIDAFIKENMITYNSPTPPELQYKEFLTQRNIASPKHYENELNAYLEEKRLCSDVSPSYAADRDFRIWYFNELLKISQSLF